MNLVAEIKKFFKGEVTDDETTLKRYSRDASLFEVRPQLVVFPKDSPDLGNLVRYIERNRERDPSLSVTIRAGGSCMSGGSLNESIIADVTRHMNHIGEVKRDGTVVGPGVFYRDFERQTLEQNLILPCYTASKDLCALGGMIANNCAGEKTLRYGQMENFILELKMIFSDGNEYVVKPLSRLNLDIKMAQGDFEGDIYKKIFNLITENREAIEQAKPRVSKNSAGYYLWNVQSRTLDKEEETFDLNRLLVGSQGTLGIVTEAKIRLVPLKSHHDMIAIFFKSWNELPRVVNAILPYDPESLETFDEETVRLGLRFMPDIAKKAGSTPLAFAAKFIPEALMGIRMLGLPKLVMLVEIVEDSEAEVKSKVKSVMAAIKSFKIWSRVIEEDSEEDKFWVMRRESFNLLRAHVGDKKAAPFVDDFCILTEKIPKFLPKALEILKDNDIMVNIAGHAGNGNFHIIPLMDLTKASERAKILSVSNRFYDLVKTYGGSITAEHNDGIMRTPYLAKMYSPEILQLFQKTKEIFDPHNIFNPGKKVPLTGREQASGSLEYLASHIATE